jgi:hypothetical protein
VLVVLFLDYSELRIPRQVQTRGAPLVLLYVSTYYVQNTISHSMQSARDRVAWGLLA